MSTATTGLAEATGIGRATLYRYFPDVDAVLTSWHERQLGTHVAHLTGILARSTDPAEQLRGRAHRVRAHVPTARRSRWRHRRRAAQQSSRHPYRGPGDRPAHGLVQGERPGGCSPQRRASQGTRGVLPARTGRGRAGDLWRRGAAVGRGDARRSPSDHVGRRPGRSAAVELRPSICEGPGPKLGGASRRQQVLVGWPLSILAWR